MWWYTHTDLAPLLAYETRKTTGLTVDGIEFISLDDVPDFKMIITYLLLVTQQQSDWRIKCERAKFSQK